MSSIKQFVYNALFKVLTVDPTKPLKQFETEDEARDEIIAMIMGELFPEDTGGAAKASPKKSPKKSPEEKAAAKAEKKAAKEAEKEAKKAEKEEKKASPKKSPADKEAKKAEKEAEKAAAKAAKEAEKEAAKAAKEAEKAAAKAAKEAEKAEKKPAKEKPAADANLPKVDPTWRKALKEADKEHAKELEPELLKYVNAMSNVAFHDKSAKEHIADFLASRKSDEVAEVEVVEVELEVVDFAGKEYYVDKETKRVYEPQYDEKGKHKFNEPVGYVGMAEFKDMTL